MRGRALSVVLLLLVMLIWGSTYVITKAGLAELPPMLFALLRFVVASLLLVPLALLRGGVARLPRPLPWGALLLMGLTGVALYYIAFNLALAYTSASQGALVQSSLPAATAVMAMVWLGERVSRRRMLGIGLAVAGVLLIVARAPADASARAPLLGNLLMSGSVRIIYLGALPSAANYLLYNRALRDLDASQVETFMKSRSGDRRRERGRAPGRVHHAPGDRGRSTRPRWRVDLLEPVGRYAVLMLATSPDAGRRRNAPERER